MTAYWKPMPCLLEGMFGILAGLLVWHLWIRDALLCIACFRHVIRKRKRR